MKKKTFSLVVGVVGGVAAIASAVVAYVQPSYAAAIVATIGIVETAAVEACGLFRKDE